MFHGLHITEHYLTHSEYTNNNLHFTFCMLLKLPEGSRRIHCQRIPPHISRLMPTNYVVAMTVGSEKLPRPSLFPCVNPKLHDPRVMPYRGTAANI